jgi:hypothetical protein
VCTLKTPIGVLMCTQFFEDIFINKYQTVAMETIHFLSNKQDILDFSVHIKSLLGDLMCTRFSRIRKNTFSYSVAMETRENVFFLFLPFETP